MKLSTINLESEGVLTFTLLPYQAQQDLAILACAQAGVADGMSASGLVPSPSTSAGHMQPVVSSAMMWSAQVQAQAMQQQQAAQQQMQVILVGAYGFVGRRV